MGADGLIDSINNLVRSSEGPYIVAGILFIAAIVRLRRKRRNDWHL